MTRPNPPDGYETWLDWCLRPGSHPAAPLARAELAEMRSRLAGVQGRGADVETPRRCSCCGEMYDADDAQAGYFNAEWFGDANA